MSEKPAGGREEKFFPYPDRETAMDELVVIEQFFTEYEAGFNRALAEPGAVNAETTAAAFADCFIAASPHGVNCGRNDRALLDHVAKGYAFYREIGVKAMRIRVLAPTPLDRWHWGVRVGWASEYEHDGRTGTIEFEVLYFLQVLDRRPRIFAWIAGDEEEAFREHGLVDAPGQGGPSGGCAMYPAFEPIRKPVRA